MDLCTIKSLCAKYGIHPSKKLGQNFLVDANVARMMIEHANLDANDLVVEVGPGFGALTMELTKRVKKVVAVEVDKRMVEALRDIVEMAGAASAPGGGGVLEIVQGDILKIPNRTLIFERTNFGDRRNSFAADSDRAPPVYKVVAALPYSITSAVLRKFTEPIPPLGGGAPPPSGGRPTLIVVLVQKEVAERVCAKPGQMSILSVAIQYYGRPEIVAVVPRTAFWPEPEVDSAILRITLSQSPPYLKGEKIVVNDKRLFQIVRIGFSSRRKQLQNNLSAGLRLPRERVLEALKQAGLDPQIRAQDLSVEQWIALASKI